MVNSNFSTTEGLPCLLILEHALKVQTDVLKRSIFELGDRAWSNSVQELADVANVD